MSEFSQTDRGSPDYIEEGGVRRYGRSVGTVESKDLASLEVPPQTLLHVTRHLAALSPEARARLRGLRVPEGEGEREVDDAFIDAELATAGSKFHPKLDAPEPVVAFAIERVLEVVRGGAAVTWVEDQRTGEQEARFVIEINPEQKSLLGLAPEEKLGTLSVIPITRDIENKVRKEQRGQGEERDRIEINVVEGVFVPQTNQLIISLWRKSAQAPVRVHTVFTGFSAPALPHSQEQTAEEFDYNRAWWDRHAFVK